MMQIDDEGLGADFPGEPEAQSPESIKIYLDAMEDIRARLDVIKRMVAGYAPFGNDGLDAEIVCLMLRKVLEQIAFASLAAHKDAYSAVHNDAEYTWRAKRLLSKLAEIHPDFWPIALRFSTDPRPAGHHHFEPVDDYLTQEEFVFLYDTASNGLHTWNPYKSGPRVLNFERSIADWVQRIEALLSNHKVSLLGTDQIWLIVMDDPKDHRVHALKANPI